MLTDKKDREEELYWREKARSNGVYVSVGVDR